VYLDTAILVKPAVSLRSLDAIHLASAERYQSWPLCSNDARVSASASTLGLPLSPLAA
jgi:predicted nucleic acid-binding protein